jgi:MFS family permease
VFTIASLLCAVSTDLTMLTFSRVAQGMGGAMMVPVGTLVVLRGTPKSELLRATAYLVWPGLLAPVLAPMVGGALTTFLSWHWIFIINVPLGLAAFIAALRLVPRTQFDAKRRLDWFGLLLTTAGVGSLVVGLETLGGHASNVLAIVVVTVGVMSLAGAVWWMSKASVPLFNLSVFGTRTFRATSTGGFIYRLTISSVPFLLPLMFQDGFGWDPLKAGVMVAAVFVGNIGIKPVTTPLIRRFGFKPVLVFASFASAVTFALCALLNAQTPEPLIFALLLFSGAFRSIGFSAYASVQYADIGTEQLPSANAISATLVQLAAAAGIAVGALFLRLFEATNVLGVDQVAAYKGAFLAMAVLMLVSTADSLALHRHAGAEVSHGAKRS